MGRLSERLKELLRKKGWTQEDMACEIYVSLSTVQRWEKKAASQPGWLAANYTGYSVEKAYILVSKSILD